MAKATSAQRERWRREIEAWRASGKPLSVWARERSISRDALEYWKRRLAPVPRTPLALIPLKALPVAEAKPIELVVGRLRLILAPGFDAPTLARALEALEGRC